MPETTPQDEQALTRTQLANERTFLSWLRSGLAAMALGVAAAELITPQQLFGVGLDILLACLLEIFGATLIVIGRLRYGRMDRAIRTGASRPTSTTLELAAMGALTLSIVATVLVIHS